MRSMKNALSEHLGTMILCLAFLILLPFSALAEETYDFDRMWPTLKQHWYIGTPSGIATDPEGNVYVAGYSNRSIYKFSPEGMFLTKWGKAGMGDGEFTGPNGVATDRQGNLYVTDWAGNCVQKFTSDGHFVARWGSEGDGEGQFRTPSGIAVDDQGYIYVADSNNDRIQKLDPNGKCVGVWGGKEGNGPGEFFFPSGIAIGPDGSVYVVDAGNHRIQKFNSDGEFLKEWGEEGSEDGQFHFGVHHYEETVGEMNNDLYIKGIAVDKDGNVYVSDSNNNRIQKFGSNGKFLGKWGSAGAGDGQFNMLSGLATDEEGNIFSAELMNQRIQKFKPDGTFSTKWGSSGDKDGEFSGPAGIAMDKDGCVYVSELWNHRIQKFDAEGKFVTTWGKLGSGEGEFDGPTGIGTDASGNVYVADLGNHRIQIFDEDGEFSSQWGGYGSEDGKFDGPMDVAVAENGDFYVADMGNYRIQKFSADGKFIRKWGAQGCGEGQFSLIMGITIGKNGDVYVSDSFFNSRIQQFTSDGEFVRQWDVGEAILGKFFCMMTNLGSLPLYGRKSSLRDVFGGSDGLSFLTDILGETGDGETGYPDLFGGLFGDSDSGLGDIPLLPDLSDILGEPDTEETDNSDPWSDMLGETGFDLSDFLSMLEILTAFENGEGLDSILDSIATAVVSNDQISSLVGSIGGIASDENGNIYALHMYDSHIHKFTSEGKRISEFGEVGSGPGMFVSPSYLCVSPDGNKIYVTDTGNNRVQLLRKGIDSDWEMSAIIVNGRKSGEDKIWTSTQACANFVHRTFTHQRIPKESISYLSPDIVENDLDNDGKPDTEDATRENLRMAIEKHKNAGRLDSLVLYFVGHGGPGTMQLKSGETLYASDLNSWLDELQKATSCEVILVYDACESGSFLPLLTSSEGGKRIVITSSKEKEKAYFQNNGLVSFSGYFWSQIFNGNDIGKSFEKGRDALNGIDQHPLLEDSSLPSQNMFIGSGISILEKNAPSIEDISPEQTLDSGDKAQLYASGVTDPDGDAISRVWAVITPPGYEDFPDTSARAFSHTEMSFVEETNRYEATCGGFDAPGIYQIAIYACDHELNTSVPKRTSVRVECAEPCLKRRAIIVARHTMEEMRIAVEHNAELAYKALRSQRYSDDDIYLMSSTSFDLDIMDGETPHLGVDGLPASDVLEHLVTEWAASNTKELTIYMVGNIDDGKFYMDDDKTLSEALNEWIDELQNKTPVRITFVCDANDSGRFLPVLFPWPPRPGGRVLISSTGENQKALFSTDGMISFSHYFWTKIFQGKSVAESFKEVEEIFQGNSGWEQSPCMMSDFKNIIELFNLATVRWGSDDKIGDKIEDVNNDGKTGMEELVYILRQISGLAK